MIEIKKIYFIFPLLLAFLLVFSNSLNTNIFANSNYTFLVWFVLMLMSFVIGWVINYSFKWEKGIKTIFIVIFSSIFLSLVLVALFRNSFDLNTTLLGNFVLYSLRIFVLGSISIFGLSVAENIKNEKIAIGKTNEEPENKLSNNSDFFIKEAKLRAEKIIFDAEKEANKINERKTQIEIQLRELIHTEREVIRNYESISSNKIENNSTTD
ncbi:MAG: hypothetical protein COW71_07025 [Ignavibacteriales bacterium CG18_big_fil_WC_8_21_14_2_50_31_20]|nr:MAG: hypothetical protein COW71_07025 [Ignavibacteriales bacterium CG18_big_fil_WC_8_21_14_2_50_31_20]